MIKENTENDLQSSSTAFDFSLKNTYLGKYSVINPSKNFLLEILPTVTLKF